MHEAQAKRGKSELVPIFCFTSVWLNDKVARVFNQSLGVEIQNETQTVQSTGSQFNWSSGSDSSKANTLLLCDLYFWRIKI